MHTERRGAVSLAELAKLVGGAVSGDPSIAVAGVAPLDLAGDCHISFLANPKYLAKVADCKAAAIVVHPSMAESFDRPLLLADNPYLAFAKILTYFEGVPHVGQGILSGAHVHDDAIIGEEE